MSARPGGEADKFGNYYEGVWTIHQMLLVLVGRADSVTVEPPGQLGAGIEFLLRCRGVNEAHQVKRQYGNANGWTMRRLNYEGVLKAAREHVEAGREFHFVSAIPAPSLSSLADRARRSANLRAFLSADWMTQELQPEFNYLSGAVYGSDEVAWQTLSGIWTHCQDEDGLRRMNEALAELLLEGAPASLAALGLGDLVYRNLSVRLDRAAIEQRLSVHELRRAQLIGSPAVSDAVAAVLASWKGSIERELLQPTIPRSEAPDLTEVLRSKENQVAVVVGAAGGGKSAVLYQSVGQLQADDWAILGLRLDRIDPFSSTTELGQRLGLSVSPVTALAATSGTRHSLLVIDQLDAVSLASGRMPQTFNAVADLIREALAFPRMRVLLACRAFDVDNDHRIRQLVNDERVARVEVPLLAADQVDAAVSEMGLPTSDLTPAQRSLLGSPLNLVLLAAIADQADALSFTSAGGLLDAYWERKRRACAARRQPPPQFGRVIGVLANAMSTRQRLTASLSVLDEDDLAGDGEVLASEHVLVRDGERYAFFHESFFDYAFARLWINRGQSLVDFLVGDRQELFRRAQVRQILQLIHDDDPERFVSEVRALLEHSEIRFHIKVVVLAVLRSLTDPTPAEWQMIKPLLSTGGPVADQLWRAVRTLPWFERLDEDGEIQRLLAMNDNSAQAHALEAMLGAIKEHPDRMAQLIAPFGGNTHQYVNWLTWVIRFADVHTSRPLFDLVLDAVRRGDYNGRDQALWGHVYGLGQQQPTWAVELLHAWLEERPRAFNLDEVGRVEALESSKHNAVELARESAPRAPELYCNQLIPYLLKVMALTEADTDRRPIRDRHFSYRQQNPGPALDLGEALLHGAVTALRSLVEQDPTTAQLILETLAQDTHDGAQWLLYEALRSDGQRYADWAGELLLEGDHRFYSGYMSDLVWTTRQLIEATAPHMSEERFRLLESTVVALRPRWESQNGTGWANFEFLSVMPEPRLSDEAKRRLGELRRRFGREQPAVPQDFLGGFIRPPIPETAAQHMNDDQWLSAMNKYRTDQADFETMTGGAFELSSLLRSEATNDPARFARLTLRLNADLPSAYANAILQALGQTSQPVDPALVFDAVRHVAALNIGENDQSLSLALHRQLGGDVPDDVIAIIIDRALHSVDPTEDVWCKEAADGQFYYGGDIFNNGINTARGQAVVTLGDLIIHDADGHRTELVKASLGQLAGDPSVAARSCVAHLLAACLRHASAEAVTAFDILIAADDRLLATRHVVELALYIGAGKLDIIEPLVARMLASSEAVVRESGGLLAAFAGLEFGLGHLLATARDSDDPAIRKGAADLCARRLPFTSDAAAAAAAVSQFVADPDEEVRKVAARVAAILRDKELRPYAAVLTDLIASDTYKEALAQLLITLQRAPDRIDDVVIACTRRFVEVFVNEAHDISTSAAGHASQVAQLILRAYAQATSNWDLRRQALDLIDGLLEVDAIGASDAVNAAER